MCTYLVCVAYRETLERQTNHNMYITEGENQDPINCWCGARLRGPNFVSVVCGVSSVPRCAARRTGAVEARFRLSEARLGVRRPHPLHFLASLQTCPARPAEARHGSWRGRADVNAVRSAGTPGYEGCPCGIRSSDRQLCARRTYKTLVRLSCSFLRPVFPKMQNAAYLVLRRFCAS